MCVCVCACVCVCVHVCVCACVCVCVCVCVCAAFLYSVVPCKPLDVGGNHGHGGDWERKRKIK